MFKHQTRCLEPMVMLLGLALAPGSACCTCSLRTTRYCGAATLGKSQGHPKRGTGHSHADCQAGVVDVGKCWEQGEASLRGLDVGEPVGPGERDCLLEAGAAAARA